MTEILPGHLWQCGIDELPAEVAAVNPFAIVNLCPREDFFVGEDNLSGKAKLYLNWPIEDGPLPDLNGLSLVVGLVTKLVQMDQPTIVHCAAGYNRSALVNIIVLRDYLHITGEQALRLVRSKRDGSCVNKAFEAYVLNLG